VINLRAWLRGERDRMRVVHVPSPQDEASRQLMRDRGQLQKEVLQHRDRMRKLLATLGCWDEVDHKHFAGRLARDEVKCHDGAPLPLRTVTGDVSRVRADTARCFPDFRFPPGGRYAQSGA
jgi:transposase